VKGKSIHDEEELPMETRFMMEKVNPNGYAATIGLEKYLQTASIDQKLKELIKIRASQINGCAFCIDKHTKDARKMGETEQRIYALNAWRETPFFTPEERAVLALTEAVTLITEGHVPDEVYSEVRRYFDETQTAELIMAIVTINAWNRIAISTRKMPPVEQE
jgi:AhpD family alkylhydroperoxidase